MAFERHRGGTSEFLDGGILELDRKLRKVCTQFLWRYVAEARSESAPKGTPSTVCWPPWAMREPVLHATDPSLFNSAASLHSSS